MDDKNVHRGNNALEVAAQVRLEDDEFDDGFDDDDFDEAFAGASLADTDHSKINEIPRDNLGCPSEVIYGEGGTDDDDDEFGNDFDDADFEAAELSATQSLRQVQSDLWSTVRPLYP